MAAPDTTPSPSPLAPLAFDPLCRILAEMVRLIREEEARGQAAPASA
jgi:hypothetical protein